MHSSVDLIRLWQGQRRFQAAHVRAMRVHNTRIACVVWQISVQTSIMLARSIHVPPINPLAFAWKAVGANCSSTLWYQRARNIKRTCRLS